MVGAARNQSELTTDGYTVIPDMLSSQQLKELLSGIAETSEELSRMMLKNKSISDLASLFALKSPLLKGLTPVLASYFPKSKSTNWFVASHRDEALPIERFHQNFGWSNPTVKEGIPHAKAPKDILEQCVALRLQLTGTSEGALSVSPGSHKASETKTDLALVPVPQCGGLFMRPLLVHSSAKIQTDTKRDILHILYGPASLPEPFKWYSFGD